MFCAPRAAEPVVFVMDSAGYSADNLESLGDVSWLMRVPETLVVGEIPVRGPAGGAAVVSQVRFVPS